MSIHSKSYSRITTLAQPGHVRPPTTLFEHYRTDPRGAASFPEWCNDRVWELMKRSARLQFFAGGEWCTRFALGGPSTVGQCMFEVEEDSRYPQRIILLDVANTVVKEWSNVEKT